MPNDAPANPASDAAEPTRDLVLARGERERLADVESALEKISIGRYGVCETCDEAIDIARLVVTPWARYCIGCALRRNHS